MQKKLRLFSIIAFAISIPSLIVTDWYFKGMGLGVMFGCLTIGLIVDQVIRMLSAKTEVSMQHTFKVNKFLNLAGLILFVQSPVALVYGNRYTNSFGTYLMIGMILIGITLNQIASHKYSLK